jgi:hypothetical protein
VVFGGSGGRSLGGGIFVLLRWEWRMHLDGQEDRIYVPCVLFFLENILGGAGFIRAKDANNGKGIYKNQTVL